MNAGVARKKRQLILQHPPDEEGAVALGSRKEVCATLARFNTAPDGSPETGGTVILHGPGLVLEIATTQREIQQAIVTLTDDEIAFPVLMRLCKSQGWSMIDLESGMSFMA